MGRHALDGGGQNMGLQRVGEQGWQNWGGESRSGREVEHASILTYKKAP